MLVRVTVLGGLGTPTGCAENVRLVGEKVTGMRLLPLSLSICGLVLPV